MSEVEAVPKPVEEKEVKEEVKKEEVKEEVSKEDVEKAFQLLAQGKRNMLCGEVPEAVNQFQEATKILAGKYGETAKECGDSYLYYGKSLLEMSRMETGVLGNALDGIEEDEDSDDKESEDKSEASDDKVEDGEKVTEEEREKISVQVYDAMEEREEEKKLREEKEKAKRKEAGEEVETEESEKEMETSEKSEEETKEEKPEEKAEEETDKKEKKSEEETDKKEEEKAEEKKDESEKPEEKEEAEKKEKAEKEEDMETEEKKDEDTATEAESEDLNTEEEGEGGETEEGKEGEGEKKEEEEDVSNLQVAWEVLELAKKIFAADDSKESKLKLAEAHLKLGEVALETEQYESAVDDFKACLKVQQSVLEADDRLLAETHYQLGVAYNLSFQYDESIMNFSSAQTVMEARVAALEKVIEESEKAGKGKEIADFEDPVYKAHKEVKELREILPDVVTKIEDVQEEQKTAEVTKAELKGTLGFGQVTEGEKKEAPASGSGEGTSAAEPANVITHLVRKKRKTEGEEEADGPKKQKLENGSGDAPDANGVNGGANGTKASPEKKDAPAAMETEVKTKTVEDVQKAAEETPASS